jgi:hypothetical protein
MNPDVFAAEPVGRLELENFAMEGCRAKSASDGSKTKLTRSKNMGANNKHSRACALSASRC